MKKTLFSIILSFVSISTLASPDRIGDAGGSVFDSIGIVIMCIIGLPIAFIIVKEWLSGNMDDDDSMGCISIIAIAAFILFVVVKCSS